MVMQKQRIAVLGAGPMGLAVAFQLIKDGHHPVVFEADDRVGGMAAAFDFDGLKIERYYHFHCISDLSFLEMLAELGLSEKMHWRETKMGYYYQQQLLPWGNPLALVKFPGLSIIAKIRYSLHIFISTKRDNWQTLDKLDAVTWIKKWVGEEAYNVLWRNLFEYKFYTHIDNISAAWIWSRIRRIGRSRYNIFKEKLGYLEGGSDTLLQAMSSFIVNNGGEIHLNEPVKRVLIEAGKVCGVRLTNHDEPFEKVISTIPLPYVPQLMPDLPPDILNKFLSVHNTAVVCIIVKLKKKLTDNFWLNVNDPTMDIPGLIEYTNLYALTEHIVYVPFYIPGDHPKFQESDHTFIEKVTRYLKAINPDLKDSDFVCFKVSRYRHAQPICAPAHLTNLPPVKLPIQGLWAADTSYYYPEDRGISESIAFGKQMAKEAIL